MKQAKSDLAHARRSLDAGAFDWACFISQQAAEKAVKALHQSRGEEAWGHTVFHLLESLRDTLSGVDAALLDRAKRLDKLYTTARYPNGFAAGAPTDMFTRSEAESALEDAEAIVGCCDRGLSEG